MRVAGALRLKWGMLGYGLLWSAYVNSVVLMGAAGDVGSRSSYVLWVVVALTVAAVAYAGRRGSCEALARRSVIATASVLVVTGVVLIGVAQSVDSGRAFYVGAGLVGLGFAVLLMLWGWKLSLLARGELSVHVVVATALAAAVSLAANLVGVSAGAVATIMVLASSLLLCDGLADGSWRDKPLRWTSTPVDIPPIRLTRRTLVNTCMLGFVLPCAYRIAVQTFFSSSLSFSLQYLEDAIVGVVLVAAFVTIGRLGLVALYRLMLPAVVSSYLLLVLVPTPWMPVFAVVGGVGTKLAQLFIWIFLVRMVTGSRRHGWIILGLGTASTFAGRITGDAVASALASSALIDSTSAASLLVVLLVTTVVSVLPRGSYMPGRDAAASPGWAELKIACTEVAERFGLTRREAEVLPLVAMGMSQSAVASRLCVSESTAHVHIAHIYQKLGMHSKQEVIDLMHSMTGDDWAGFDGGLLV